MLSQFCRDEWKKRIQKLYLRKCCSSSRSFLSSVSCSYPYEICQMSQMIQTRSDQTRLSQKVRLLWVSEWPPDGRHPNLLPKDASFAKKKHCWKEDTFVYELLFFLSWWHWSKKYIILNVFQTSMDFWILGNLVSNWWTKICPKILYNNPILSNFLPWVQFFRD